MILFKKENGFPEDLTIETERVEEDLGKEDGVFKGYKSRMFNGKGKLIKEFYHTDLRARVHWADGYFTALRKKWDWRKKDNYTSSPILPKSNTE